MCCVYCLLVIFVSVGMSVSVDILRLIVCSVFVMCNCRLSMIVDVVNDSLSVWIRLFFDNCNVCRYGIVGMMNMLVVVVMMFVR